MIKRIPTIISSIFVPKFSFCSVPFSQDSFYDWSQPNSYVRAVRENYFLKDIMEGYHYLKQQKIQLNQQHVTFLAYIFMLFPESEEVILPDLIDGFHKWEEDQSTQDRIPEYILYLRNVNSSIRLAPFVEKMQARLNNIEKLNSFEEMQKVLNFVGFMKIGGLTPFHDHFRSQFCELILKKKYKLDLKEINLIIEIYKHLKFFDEDLKKLPFLSSLPTTFQEDQEILKNMLNTFLHVMTKHFVSCLESKDLQVFHKNLSECHRFQSTETQKLLRRYSENLVTLQLSKFINFTNIMKPISQK